jgi:hypothetical protein
MRVLNDILGSLLSASRVADVIPVPGIPPSPSPCKGLILPLSLSVGLCALLRDATVAGLDCK